MDNNILKLVNRTKNIAERLRLYIEANKLDITISLPKWLMMKFKEEPNKLPKEEPNKLPKEEPKKLPKEEPKIKELKNINYVKGEDTEIVTPSYTYKSYYAVVELDDLQPSHIPSENFKPNPNYPASCQTREYYLNKYEKDVFNTIIYNFNPSHLINNSPDATTGTPIIMQNGVVLGGNKRTMILKSLPKEKMELYQSMLKRKSEFFDIMDISKFKTPILVRIIDNYPIDKCSEISYYLNTSNTTSYSELQEGLSYSRIFRENKYAQDNLIELIDEYEFETISELLNNPQAQKRIIKLLEDIKIINTINRASYINANNKLTEKGELLVEYLFMASVIPQERYLNMAKIFSAKIIKTLPLLFKIANYPKEYNLLPYIYEAFELEIERRNAKLEVRDVGKLIKIFEDKEPTIEGIHLYMLLSDKIYPQKVFKEFMKYYVKAVDYIISYEQSGADVFGYQPEKLSVLQIMNNFYKDNPSITEIDKEEYRLNFNSINNRYKMGLNDEIVKTGNDFVDKHQSIITQYIKMTYNFRHRNRIDVYYKEGYIIVVDNKERVLSQFIVSKDKVGYVKGLIDIEGNTSEYWDEKAEHVIKIINELKNKQNTKKVNVPQTKQLFTTDQYYVDLTKTPKYIKEYKGKDYNMQPLFDKPPIQNLVDNNLLDKSCYQKIEQANKKLINNNNKQNTKLKDDLTKKKKYSVNLTNSSDIYSEKKFNDYEKALEYYNSIKVHDFPKPDVDNEVILYEINIDEDGDEQYEYMQSKQFDNRNIEETLYLVWDYYDNIKSINSIKIKPKSKIGYYYIIENNKEIGLLRIKDHSANPENYYKESIEYEDEQTELIKFIINVVISNYDYTRKKYKEKEKIENVKIYNLYYNEDNNENEIIKDINSIIRNETNNKGKSLNDYPNNNIYPPQYKGKLNIIEKDGIIFFYNKDKEVGQINRKNFAVVVRVLEYADEIKQYRDILRETLKKEMEIQGLADVSLVKSVKTKSLQLSEKMKELLGQLTDNFSMLIYGRAGGGKSTLSLQLAKDLQQEGNLLYFTTEEKISAGRIGKRLALINTPETSRIYFDDSVDVDSLKSHIESKQFKFIIIDSINMLPMETDDLLQLISNNKEINFILIAHATKGQYTTYKGKSEIAHFVDVVIQVENGMAQTEKNRNGESGKIIGIFDNKTINN